MNVIEEAELLKSMFIRLLIATRIAGTTGIKSVDARDDFDQNCVLKPVGAPVFIYFCLS